MQTNHTKRQLRAGEPVFGCFIRHSSAGLVEFLALLGWDFLVFDAEHGPIAVGECEHMVRAAELRGSTPLVRVSTSQPPQILRYLDTGAQGVHTPWVESGADAEMTVKAVKYQPRGNRGLAASRATDYGQDQPLASCIRTLNDQTLVVVQIESMKAVEALPEIVATDGIDVAFIGLTDLSNSLGLPGETKHPEVQAAIQQIVAVVVESNVALGIMVSDAKSARAWREKGALYIATTLEALLHPAGRSFLKDARGAY